MSFELTHEQHQRLLEANAARHLQANAEFQWFCDKVRDLRNKLSDDLQAGVIDWDTYKHTTGQIFALDDALGIVDAAIADDPTNEEDDDNE